MNKNQPNPTTKSINPKKQTTPANIQQTNSIKQSPKSPNYNKKLNEQLKQLETKLKAEFDQQKQSLIQKHELELKSQLEAQKKTFNELFLQKIQEKANQAEKLVKTKIQENEAKFQTQFQELKKYCLEKPAGNLVDILEKFFGIVQMESNDPAVKNYIQGFRMFANMFEQFLTEHHITKIPTKLKDEFNPEWMEAFESDGVSDPNLHNKVTKIISHAYKLHDRIIKFAVVRVGVYTQPKQ